VNGEGDAPKGRAALREVLTFALFLVMALGFWHVQSMGGMSMNEPDPRSVVRSVGVVAEEEFAEKVLEVPILVLGMPEGYKVRLFPSAVKVACRLPMGRYRDLETTDVVVSIPFEELQQAPARDIGISARVPDWIRNVRTSPERIEFLIEAP
jgi:hypothetical protein